MRYLITLPVLVGNKDTQTNDVSTVFVSFGIFVLTFDPEKRPVQEEKKLIKEYVHQHNEYYKWHKSFETEEPYEEEN